MNKNAFENQFLNLIGKRIIRVRYYEIEYPESEHMWQCDSRYDSIDFGLDLLCDDDSLFAISWGSEFCKYGISLDQSFLPTSKGYRSIDVSNISRWHDFINTKITDIKIIWSWAIESDSPKQKIYYPQDLILSFDNGRNVFISALQIDTDDSFMGMTDNITVFFDKDTASKFKVQFEA